MKKLLLLSFCLLWSALCFSQDWFPIAGNDDIMWEADLSSIERAGNLIYCWGKLTYKNEDAKLKMANKLYKISEDKKWLKYSYTLTYTVYDCSGKKNQTLSYVYYDINGSSIYSNDTPELSINYERLVPGTIGMSIFNQLNEEHVFEVDGKEFKVYIENVSSFLYENPNAKYLGNAEWVEYITSFYNNKNRLDEDNIED